MLYFQMFLSLVVFISYCVNPKFFGLNFQEADYIAIQSIGLIILGPILGILLKRFYHSIVSVDSSIKFSLAMLTITICFCLLYAIVKFSQSTMLIAPISILFIYILVSVSEILLSPFWTFYDHKTFSSKNCFLYDGDFLCYFRYRRLFRWSVSPKVYTYP